jgi:glycosyltransferase involved in cell wall biosynthesis
MSNQSTKISILLPTRGRTDALDRSIVSLINLASDPKNLQFIIAFDNDDKASSAYFVENIAPKINNAGSGYTCLEFVPMGYIRLNEYVNQCAKVASGDWLMFWNDDAFMESADWDKEIIKHTGEFCCLRMPTHNEHPYAIFPIVPGKWYELFGYLSPHQISDAWISQMSYMLDIMKNIDVKVVHDRHDLTGNNNDETFKNRPMLEGNPNQPQDFNHDSWRKRRVVDCVKINTYLKTVGQDTEWFRNVFDGKQDPWEKMCGPECDPNKQLSKYKTK